MSYPYSQVYSSDGSGGIYSSSGCSCGTTGSSSSTETPAYEWRDDFSAGYLLTASTDELRLLSDKTWFLSFNGLTAAEFDVTHEVVPSAGNVTARGNLLLRWNTPSGLLYRACYMANFYQCSPNYGRIEYECRARMSHVGDSFIDTRGVFIGLGSLYHPVSKSGFGLNGSCGFSYSSADSAFWRRSYSTSAYGDGISTSENTTVTTDTSFTIFKMILTTSGTDLNVEYFINGTAAGTSILSNSNTLQLGPRIFNGYNKTTDPIGTDFGLWVDYVSVKQY